ncbi:hypothetical protein HanIR_Chr06g0273861 [Helianthus annuus]|nr:hypothetical protein HanIR_Chr06g0273861 [Helianthus annuus]
MAPTTTTTLVGPPEIYRSHQNTTVSPPSSTTTTTSHPFIDAMISHFNSTTLSPTDPPMGYTENNSATYLSTGEGVWSQKVAQTS